jgi:hypothetical protein
MANDSKITMKKLFTADFEVHASVKMLYPYIQTAGGLSEWFADNVTISPEKLFTFVWDNESHHARMTGSRINHFCKFEFVPEPGEDKADPSWFELRLEINELTQTTFIRVFENLRKVVGG